MSEHVIYEKKGYRAYITLNKPEKLNAFDTKMYRAVGEYLDLAGSDEDVRVVILKGNGRAFSAGYDIAEEVSTTIMEDIAEIEDICNQTRWKIWNLRKPVIGQVHGYCLGGACELTLPCDYIIASEDLKIGEPIIQFGALSVFLMIPWLVNMRRAKELLLTGEKITGKEAAEIGLVTRAVPADRLEEEVEALADKLIRVSPPAMHLQKRMLNRSYEIMGLRSAIDSAADLSAFVKAVPTKEVEMFNEIVDRDGVKAALAWQTEYFSGKK